MGLPFTEGNAIERLRNGDEIFPAMLDAISRAESRVDLLTFVYWTGEIAERFADALAARARDGIAVRVLLDDFGSGSMRAALRERMTDAGVDVRNFRPVVTWRVWRSTHRTHRKVLVVDEQVAFTGGVGIAQEWEGDARDPSEWRDSHFRVRGPAVSGLQGAFTANWLETGAALAVHGPRDDPPPAGEAEVQVVRSSANQGWSDIATMLRGLISVAERRLRISTAYFAPDDDFVRHFCGLADRGVSVQVMIPGPHVDRRLSELSATPLIAPLLEAGVEVWAFQPTMLHLKAITVDEKLAAIGSPNFNHRSLQQDDEVALVVLDRGLVATLDADFEEDLSRCEPITLEGLRSRGPARRFREAAARPFRSHL